VSERVHPTNTGPRNLDESRLSSEGCQSSRGSLPHGDFGAKGDLSRWKLIPAIGNLAAANRLPSRFAIVGFAFYPLTTESFRQQLDDEIKTLASVPIDREFSQSLLARPFRLENMRPSSRVRRLSSPESRRSKPGNGLYWG
jgi:glucose-6-phosphate 1-dehydrogenase